jgi:cytochrome c oxidase subunit II
LRRREDVRRLAARIAVAMAMLCCVGYVAAPLAVGDAATRRIPLLATKFAFDKPEIRVRRGEAVTLLLTSPDFVHGFSIPDLDARIDLIPGRTAELHLKPARAGRFAFLCDNFCGEGHDRMTGWLIVEE